MLCSDWCQITVSSPVSPPDGFQRSAVSVWCSVTLRDVLLLVNALCHLQMYSSCLCLAFRCCCLVFCHSLGCPVAGVTARCALAVTAWYSAIAVWCSVTLWDVLSLLSPPDVFQLSLPGVPLLLSGVLSLSGMFCRCLMLQSSVTARCVLAVSALPSVISVWRPVL